MNLIKIIFEIFCLCPVLILSSCGYPEEYESAGQNSENKIMGIEIILPVNKIMENQSVKAELLFIEISGEKLQSYNENIIWESSDNPTFTVDNDGVIKGVKTGHGILYAHVGKLAADAELDIERETDYSKIKLSEIYYDLPGSDSGGEFIEIYNGNEYSCNISNFIIVDGNKNSTPFILPFNTTIGPLEYMVVSSFSFSLNNNGETVFFKNATGLIIDEVYIEGGSADFPAPLNWDSFLEPRASEGLSVRRIEFPGTGIFSDWDTGTPTPGSQFN